jgi:hypothetical protein
VEEEPGGALGLVALLMLPCLAWASEALPKLGVELDATSVSGLSAGAYMAGQIELTHGSHIKGAGIVAGGPFACAESPAGREHVWWNWWGVSANLVQSGTSCMQVDAGAPDAGALAARAKELAQAGELDPSGKSFQPQDFSVHGRAGSDRAQPRCGGGRCLL